MRKMYVLIKDNFFFPASMTITSNLKLYATMGKVITPNMNKFLTPFNDLCHVLVVRERLKSV